MGWRNGHSCAGAGEGRVGRWTLDTRSAGSLRRVSLDGVIELAKGGSIHAPVDIFQLPNGQILFAAEFAGSFTSGNSDYDGPPAVRFIRGRDRLNSDCSVRTKGPAIITHLQSRTGEFGEYSTIEGVASEVVLRIRAARQMKDLSARECEATVHNFRPVRSDARRYPTILARRFGISATLTPQDDYRDAASTLEYIGGNRSTYKLRMRSLRKGSRRTSSWISLCNRICMFLSLQNLSSVWVSCVAFRQNGAEWHHWVYPASRPFSTAGKDICDGIVWPTQALDIALSQSATRRLRQWRHLVNYMLDAVTQNRELEYKTLLLCTMLDSVGWRHFGERSQKHMLTAGQRRVVTKGMSGWLEQWADHDGGVNAHDLLEVCGNIPSIFRPSGSSFRENTERLIAHCDLPDEVPVDNIVDVRHSLVHRGDFPKHIRGDFGQYRKIFRQVTWTSAALLWRLLGFQGRFPEFGSFYRP